MNNDTRNSQAHFSPQSHLSPEQFCELVERGALETGYAVAQAHLNSCELCRTELNSMREALALFRKATAAFAEREFARASRVETTGFAPLHRSFSHGLAWAAAGLLVLATGLPLSLRHWAPAPPATHSAAAAAATAPLSDEALLDDINREVSASVPASMQALDDPTGSASVTATGAQTSSTRKN